MPKTNQPTPEVATAAFLDLIHGPGARIYFQVAGKTWKNKPQTYFQAENKLRWRNQQGDDIGFVVNTGGTTNGSITRINAFWIDWDGGRDPDGHYHPSQVVTQLKAEFTKSLLDPFQPPPSIVVETRNGYQAYWLASEGVTVEEFQEVQARLCSYFHSDPNVNRACNVMRLPGYDWVKPTSGLPRFPVQVIRFTSIRYGADAFQGLPLPVDQEETPKAYPAFGHHNKCSGIDTHCTYCGVISPLSSQPPIVLTSMTEAIEFIKKQDLAQYLNLQIDRTQLPQTVLCPFHPDSSPSATIHCDPASGHWLFRCHSSRCNLAGTIIDLCKHQLNKPEKEVYRHLLQYYRIEIDTGWKTAQIKVLDDNVAVIGNQHTLQAYTFLHKLIGRITKDLIGKLNLSKQYVVSERNQHKDQVVFFCSLRELNRLAQGKNVVPRHFGAQAQKVDRYCTLGLMRKLPDRDVPQHLLVDAQKRKKQGGYRIQFYAFPAYTPAVLQEADRRARVLSEAGASVRGISREMIADVLGQNIANEVYPQQSKNMAGNQFRKDVEAVLMGQIASRGFSTSAKLRKALARKTEYTSVTDRRIEKCLPGILKTRGLEKKICTKALKQKLGVSSRGYPKVIVPADKSSGMSAVAGTETG